MPGLSAIDHLAQSMNYEEMLTWLLFYTAIFRTKKLPMVDVIDPAGIVRSQVVESDDGGLRLTLNGAENRRTLAGHFIAENFGSGVQHLAFSSCDIFRTADRLAELGFSPLEISANYYDDLEARLGLEPEFTKRLRDRNILYDRDEGGDYFQLYSQTYGEGFFFEIVERRGLSRLRGNQCSVPDRCPEADAAAKRHAEDLTATIATTAVRRRST